MTSSKEERTDKKLGRKNCGRQEEIEDLCPSTHIKQELYKNEKLEEEI
jgi:hypothetical protein